MVMTVDLRLVEDAQLPPPPGSALGMLSASSNWLPCSKAAATKITTTVTRTECAADAVVRVRPVPATARGTGRCLSPTQRRPRPGSTARAALRAPGGQESEDGESAARSHDDERQGPVRKPVVESRVRAVDLCQRRERKRSGENAGHGGGLGGASPEAVIPAAACLLMRNRAARQARTATNKAPMSSEVGPVRTARSLRAGVGRHPARCDRADHSAHEERVSGSVGGQVAGGARASARGSGWRLRARRKQRSRSGCR